MVIRLFVGTNRWTAFAMFEGAVMAILRKQKAEHGLQRFYANTGGMISSPLSSLLMNYASKGKGYTDFSNFLILNFHDVLNVAFFLFGESPVSEF
jgi:hypothetical protein